MNEPGSDPSPWDAVVRDLPDPTPRQRHYGAFHQLEEVPEPDGRPLIAVFGNCQAESLRVLLGASPAVRSIRLPPVFELTADDLPRLAAVLQRVDVLLAQPVRDDYADLELGTRQVAARLRPDARVLRWPVLRWTGLHPFHGIIRDPDEPAAEPPLVPYHDLRTLTWAATGRDPWPGDTALDRLREVGERSLAELQRRQVRDCDVGVADLLAQPVAGDMVTLNHPGNRLLVELARRVQSALGLPVDAADPGRVLLGSVVAPVDPRIETVWQLDRGSAPTDEWRLGDRVLPAVEVHRAQRDWYLDRPRVIEAGLQRHEQTLQILGLG